MTIRVGAFTLDLRSRELCSGAGRVVRLQEQPFEILQRLAERPGEVVTRHELRQALWPAGTFVDFEHSLNAAVKRLRAALDDNAGEPRYVETVPRRGYRLIALVAGERPVSVDGAAPFRAELGQEPRYAARVAVLPFVNLSEDPSWHFSDGLTEEVVVQLGHLCGTRIGVLAPGAHTFTGVGARRVRDIGADLRAEYVLEGSVRREGGRLRVTARLVETEGETYRWSETYERDVTDALSAQVDVAERMALSLAANGLPGSRDRARLQPAQAEANQAYLKGQYYWNKPGDEGLAESVYYFDQALLRDPCFAAAQASKARALVAQAEYYNEPSVVVLERARTAALRAVELDPTHWRGYVALGDVHRLLEWNWAGAERAYRQATALNPDSESAHRAYAVLLAVSGRFSEAVREGDRALALDPLCLVVGTSVAWVHYVAGDYEGVLEQCRHSIDMDQRYSGSLARRLQAAAYLRLGRPAEAVTLLELAREASGDEPILLSWLAHAKAVAGDRDGAHALVTRIRTAGGDRPVPAYHLALACVGLGDGDAAFAWLDRACRDRDPALAQVRVEPRFEPLHADPRYRALVARLGLQPLAPEEPEVAGV